MRHRKSRKTKHHGRRLLSFAVLIVVLAGIVNYARPLPTTAATPAAVSSSLGAVNLSWPKDGATAAVGAVGYGLLDAESSPALPTASIAKLITALTVLKVKPLTVGQQGPTITITAQDVAIYNDYVSQDGSVVQVTQGETLTEYQALQAMLLPSANNIADALAIWAYGSLSAYATAATNEAASLGLSHTTIGTDASGLSPTTTSTPSNLVQLGIVGLQNPVIAQIVNEPDAVLPVVGTIQNVNSLLGKYGIDGIKTGNSDQADGCYLFSVPFSIGNQNITIVGAIMHAPTLQAALQDAIPLLNSAEQNFTVEKPVTAGGQFGSYTSPWGATATAVAEQAVSLAAWQGTTLTPRLNLDSLSRPAPAGTIVGSIAISSGKHTASSPLILQHALSPPKIWWRLTRH